MVGSKCLCPVGDARRCTVQQGTRCAAGAERDICLAVVSKAVITFTHGGHERIVEPFYHGRNERDVPTLSGYQRNPGGKSGKVSGWREYHVSGIVNLRITDE